MTLHLPRIRVATILRRTLFPPVCPICLVNERQDGHDLCTECDAELRELPEPRCAGCGGTIDGVLKLCAGCLQGSTRPWQRAVSTFAFGSNARELIHRFKYRRHTYLAPVLAQRMAQNWTRFGKGMPDTIVPVPLHWLRQLMRGYNQALFLAQFVGRELDVPCSQPLRRHRWTAQQALLNSAKRQTNVKRVFTARRGLDLKGRHVLLVDDVITTGATMAEATRVLLAANAAEVSILTAARG